MSGYRFEAKYKENWGDEDNSLFPFPSNSYEDYAIDYSLFNAQIGLVPKLNLYMDDDLWFFLENEFSIGLFTGNFKYFTDSRYKNKRIANHIMSYSLSLGVGTNIGKVPTSISIGYSTLNFRGNIRRYKPVNFESRIPNQNAAILLNILCRIPIKKGKK